MLTLDIRHSMCFFMLEPPKSDTIFVRHFFQRWVEWATTSTPRENEKNVPSKVHSMLKSEKKGAFQISQTQVMYKAQLRYKDRVNNKILSFVLYPYFLT